MTDKWIMHVPVISTGHLTEETANTEVTLDFEGPGGLYVVATPGDFMVYNSGHVSEDPEIPNDLKQVLAWAEANGYEWVRFNADGDRIEELPWYEW